MDEKELAEKVESILDLRSKGGLGVMDWQAFGLMVEKADQNGFGLKINGGWLSFYKPSLTSHPDDTSHYSTGEHGHIKACALAFVEIPPNTLSPQKDSQGKED